MFNKSENAENTKNLEFRRKARKLLYEKERFYKNQKKLELIENQIVRTYTKVFLGVQFIKSNNRNSNAGAKRIAKILLAFMDQYKFAKFPNLLAAFFHAAVEYTKGKPYIPYLIVLSGEDFIKYFSEWIKSKNPLFLSEGSFWIESPPIWQRRNK